MNAITSWITLALAVVLLGMSLIALFALLVRAVFDRTNQSTYPHTNSFFTGSAAALWTIFMIAGLVGLGLLVLSGKLTGQ